MRQEQFPKIYRGEDNRLYAPCEDGSVEELQEMFPLEQWNCPEAFQFAGVKGYEPMTAKEIDSEEQQEVELSSSDNIIEEKFDGTRGIVQFFSQETLSGEKVGYCRVFSRRISKKSGFYTENTDSVPQIRDIDVPDLDGTVIDGEMFINGQPFKEVSSTLNCLWDRAVDRQVEKGFISLHAFDIIKYKGIDLRRMPLIDRKEYLKRVVEEVNSPYIEFVPYYACGDVLRDSNGETVSCYCECMKRVGEFNEDQFLLELEDNKDNYPELYKSLKGNDVLTPKAYYELIVSTGGEGVIVKPKSGKYYHKRGREYQKIKKFLTREVIIMGFTEPTDVYEGKFPKDRWSYWVDSDDNRLSVSETSEQSAKDLLNKGYTPVTRFYYYHMIGNIRYGVVITNDEIAKLPKSKKFEIETMLLEGETVKVVEVGDCAGFDDDMRMKFSFTWVNRKTGETCVIAKDNEKNNKNIVNSPDWKRYVFEGDVIEVKANELFKDTGKMRHPRFLRLRPDKSPLACVWNEHIM